MHLPDHLKKYLSDNIEEHQKQGYDIYVYFSPLQKDTNWPQKAIQNFEEIISNATEIQDWIEKPNECDPDPEMHLHIILGALEDWAFHSTVFLCYYQLFSTTIQSVSESIISSLNIDIEQNIKRNIELISSQHTEIITNLYREAKRTKMIYIKFSHDEFAISEFFNELFYSSTSTLTIWNQLKNKA